MAGDIAMLRIYFDEYDTNVACLNPIRYIVDEHTASASMVVELKHSGSAGENDALAEPTIR